MLTIQGDAMNHSTVTPLVEFNGRRILVPEYGTVEVGVPAGPLHIRAGFKPAPSTSGQAHLDVDIIAGQPVHVFYAPPVMKWSEGRLGLVPQKRQGNTSLLLLVAVLPAVLMLGLVLLWIFVG